MIAFDLTDEQREFRDLARRFARETIRPIAPEADESEEVPWEVLEKAHQVGLLNYGLPEMTGRSATGFDVAAAERALRQAISTFEPRILPESLRVRAVVSRDEASHNAVAFEIEGQLWARPVPVHLMLKTEINVESGDVTLIDESGQKVG